MTRATAGQRDSDDGGSARADVPTSRAAEPIGAVAVEGYGLHSGAWCRVELRRCSGPVAFVQHGLRAPLAELRVTRTDHGVQIGSAMGIAIDLVEHLCSALHALGAFQGVEIEVEGPELPLLDGGSGRWLDALNKLHPRRSPAVWYVEQRAELGFGASQYRFAPAEDVSFEVHVAFAELGLTDSAAWRGDTAAYAKLAAARTFGFLRDQERLQRAGRAAYVDPDAVLVFDDDGMPVPPATPPRRGELAQHKLLDLIGDVYLCGGLAAGTLSAVRPGHTATHAVWRRAIDLGVLTRRSA